MWSDAKHFLHYALNAYVAPFTVYALINISLFGLEGIVGFESLALDVMNALMTSDLLLFLVPFSICYVFLFLCHLFCSWVFKSGRTLHFVKSCLFVCKSTVVQFLIFVITFLIQLSLFTDFDELGTIISLSCVIAVVEILSFASEYFFLSKKILRDPINTPQKSNTKKRT